MNNILLENQNIFTLAPIIIGGLTFVMIITGKFLKDKLLFVNLVADGICLSLVNFGKVEECIWIITFTLCGSVLYSLFRKRGDTNEPDFKIS